MNYVFQGMNVILDKHPLLPITLLGIIILGFLLRRKDKAKSLLVFIFAALVVSIHIMDYIADLCVTEQTLFYHYVCSAFCYSSRVILVLILILMVGFEFSDTAKYLLFGLALLNILVYFSSYWTGLGMYYEIQGNQVIFYRGDLNYLSSLTMFLYGLVFFVLQIRKTGGKYRHRLLLVGALFIMVTISGFSDVGTMNDNFCDYLSIAVFIAFLYFDIEDADKLARQQEMELRFKQQELMLSQIRPHFLYNTLGTIRHLIKTDPPLASDTVTDLAVYLRSNINAVGLENPIPFHKELENTRTYIRIEQLRFPHIKISYDLKDMDFTIPALSVQPLVENSIKHGVRNVENGEVIIRSYMKDDIHYVEIEDNGQGFDPENVEYHAGIKNVQERMKLMMEGTLTIDSKEGQGTKITLTVPEKY